ncbi:MAG: flagellar protein FlaG [Pseudomonadota bacterium]
MEIQEIQNKTYDFLKAKDSFKMDSKKDAGSEKSRFVSIADTVQSESSDNSDTDTEQDIAIRVNDYLASIGTDLKVEINRENHRAIFKIIRTEDQKVISEVPAKKMLELEANIEKMLGSLFNAQA